MKKWLRKSFIALGTILTFGLITPYQTIQATNDHLNKSNKDDVFESSESAKPEQNKGIDYQFTQEIYPTINREDYLKEIVSSGELKAWEKFGKKIGPVIEDEFNDVILPNIERVIEEVTYQFSDEDLAHLSISETTGGGTSEKIFHIFNEKLGKDVIRFHVRRDLRPLEGYWFNFHYHTYHDNFQKHYELGNIYWDKNTPPNWKN